MRTTGGRCWRGGGINAAGVGGRTRDAGAGSTAARRRHLTGGRALAGGREGGTGRDKWRGGAGIVCGFGCRVRRKPGQRKGRRKERKATGEEEEGGDGPGLDQNGLSRGRRGKRQVMEKEMCARCVREFPCTFDQSSLARTE